ncbi:ROK family protein [Herbiconiux sp. CPCC 205763]|uniref:ROK family protein n=1 Tax=Herbiconiux aconitum TaxID=2970913 RepID=A0ABT2GLU0_9MICO|nr:ROK family protein [Herbiconiux aconitum]MCS5717168.1 ROK family protein [Herbiconiux aconitum]
MIGIDVGGTTIKGIRVSIADAGAGADGAAALAGPIEAELRVHTPTPDPTGERIVEAVAGLVESLGGATDAAIGLAVPGIVDEARGLALWSSNVGLRDAPIRALAEGRLGTAVALGQDVRAGALAEVRSGAARDVDGSVAFVPIGTGVAAAFLVHGHPLVSGGWAGEIGQIVLRSGPFAGLRVEEVASASATARRAGEPNARAVAVRVAAGDESAIAVWADTISVLADALAGIVVTVAPTAIVVGGGLAQAGPLLFDPLRVAVAERIGHLRAPQLVAARHGDQAGALGAAYLAADLAADLAAGRSS